MISKLDCYDGKMEYNYLIHANLKGSCKPKTTSLSLSLSLSLYSSFRQRERECICSDATDAKSYQSIDAFYLYLKTRQIFIDKYLTTLSDCLADMVVTTRMSRPDKKIDITLSIETQDL